jgi:hypothetical protein
VNGAARVALFSGGLDSACGVGSRDDPATTCPVSFYTLQMDRQNRLCDALGVRRPVQWSWSRRFPEGRGQGFFYRAFPYLALTAVTARSLGTTEILQFENGILAYAVPPSASLLMTRHAHPRLHEYCASLFGTVLGGGWQISNPFRRLTKREGYQQLVDRLGPGRAQDIANDTETCWALRSPRSPGGEKKPGVACGVCIPCLVRRTAVLSGRFKWDLTRTAAKNHPQRGRAFWAYYNFLRRVRATAADRPAAMLPLLDGLTRGMMTGQEAELAAVFRLYRQFASEFWETFSVQEA